MPRLNDIDRKILARMSGPERIKRLLEAQGLTIAAAARRMRESHRDNVSRCIGNRRPLPRIRTKLARLLGVSRQEIDELIEN